MSAHETPSWLADLQARFGNTLRTPLDRTSGTLTATPATYDAALVAEVGSERLAVYNRQYWFRLFGVLHDAFPLTARLVGYWAFNEHAGAYLAAHPPRTWDLDDVPAGFADFFVARATANVTTAATGASADAVRIDAAYREVFRAPPVTAFHPSADDAARLLDSRLVPSPAVAFVREHFPLLELRRQALALGADSSTRLAVPPPLPTPRDWAIVRGESGTTSILLEPREAELLGLLAAHPVGEALARLESACPESERAALPAATQRWLARSVQLGFWTSLAPA